MRQGSAPDAWESWPSEVMMKEVETFKTQAASATGASVLELKGKFGVPQEEAAGTRWLSPDGTPSMQADRDLRYFNLLPHTIVSFAVVGDRVANVFFIPKWRRCPAELIQTLGGAYAAC